ncbi:MFS transporter [Rothia nasimurium]|uniref:MFS transporter n=1 Tax=Rothia nasimurium TaxID=85336 RepID=UPI003B9F35D4
MSETFEGYRPGSREYRRLLIAMFAAGVATFAQLYSPQPLIPEIARDLQISPDAAALTMSCATAGLALCTLLWAAVADRFGRVRTMMAAICGATALGLTTPWIDSYPLMLALRTLEGAFLGGVAGLAVAVIVSEAHLSARAAAAGLYISGTSIGGLSGRIIAGPLSEVVPWRMAMLAVSVVGLVAALIFFLLIPPSHDRPSSRPHQLLKEGQPQDSEPPTPTVQKVAGLFRTLPILALWFGGFALMGSLVSVYNYIGFKLQAPPYSLSQLLLSLIFLMYLFGTFSSSFGASLAHKRGLKGVFIGSCLTMAAGALLTLASPLPLIVVGLIIFTTGFFSAHAIASGWAGAIGGNAKTQATALYNSFYYAGSALVGWGTGVIYTWAGWPGTALTCVGLLLASALFSALALPGRPPAATNPAGVGAS